MGLSAVCPAAHPPLHVISGCFPSYISTYGLANIEGGATLVSVTDCVPWTYVRTRRTGHIISDIPVTFRVGLLARSPADRPADRLFLSPQRQGRTMARAESQHFTEKKCLTRSLLTDINSKSIVHRHKVLHAITPSVYSACENAGSNKESVPSLYSQVGLQINIYKPFSLERSIWQCPRRQIRSHLNVSINMPVVL